MFKSYILNPIQDVPILGWALLGIILIVRIFFHGRTYWKFKNNQIKYGILDFCKQEYKSILTSVLMLYMALIFCVTILGRNQFEGPYWELIPFWSWRQAMVDIINDGNYMMFGQIVINILMFIPAGFLLYYIKLIRFKSAFFFAFLFSLFIELLQLTFQIGLFEWDDMLHNALGCLLGVQLGRCCKKMFSFWNRKKHN